jgi:dynein heavy chain
LPLQDKRVADEQEKAVNADAIKIGKEAEEANAIAQQAGDP